MSFFCFSFFVFFVDLNDDDDDDDDDDFKRQQLSENVGMFCCCVEGFKNTKVLHWQ